MDNNTNTHAGAKQELHETKHELNEKSQEADEKQQKLQDKKRKMWFTIAGGVALLVTGIILYRKKQTKLGATLMTNSVSMIAGAIPAALPSPTV